MPLRSKVLRILLVEDNPGDARLLRELLREGAVTFDLVHAERLAAAQEVLRDGEVDVILLDLSLPDARGLETVERMLACESEAPILVLTGLDDEDAAVQAVQAGAQDYLVKGHVDPVGLVRAMRYGLERKRLEMERVRLLHNEREARALAEAAVRARDEVLRVVAHDLGNSLSAVSIQAMLLERTPHEKRDDEVVRSRTGAIRHLVGGMQRLRQDLLDVASIDAGRLSIEPTSIDIHSAVAEALSVYGSLAGEKEIHLLSRLPEELPRAQADRARLLQVLGNLLGNAIKFTAQGGEVVVAVTPGDAVVHFAVSDTGVGIPPEDLPHVFDRFWKARKGNRQGAGLGLAIVHGIVEAHGGRIWAESTAGVGSTFHFEIPVAPES